MAGFFSGVAKQKFGQVPGYLGGQGIGDGRIEQQQYDMMQDQGGAMQPDMGSMTRKPFFQRSGVKQGIGILGDTLSILGGGQATYAPAMVDQRKQDAEIRARLQAQSEQRKAGREDYAWKAQYDKVNKPPEEDQLTQWMRLSGIDPASEQGRKMYGTALQNKVNPPQYRQGGDGKFYRIDIGDATPPTFTDDDWNQGQPMGGSVGNGTGGFR